MFTGVRLGVQNRFYKTADTFAGLDRSKWPFNVTTSVTNRVDKKTDEAPLEISELQHNVTRAVAIFCTQLNPDEKVVLVETILGTITKAQEKVFLSLTADGGIYLDGFKMEKVNRIFAEKLDI